jgi:hypothetical protein
MKKMIFLGCLVLFLAPAVCAQEKIKAPIWNVGDKWVFDREGHMEVTGRDAQCYAVKFSGGIFPKDASGIALFERSTLNVKYILEGDQRKEYRSFRKKILNFPLGLGKQWEDLYQRKEYATGLSASTGTMVAVECQESFRVLGWKEVEVRAGQFKALKVEYKIQLSWRERYGPGAGIESKAWYWYSSEVKNFVKCQYEKGYQEALIEERGARADWELVSYELKK